jgi:hypothetical protein
MYLKVVKCFILKLILGDCLYRTTGNASTAAAALICVNLVMLSAFGDCIAGTSRSTCSAANAGIGNFVSH